MTNASFAVTKAPVCFALFSAGHQYNHAFESSPEQRIAIYLNLIKGSLPAISSAIFFVDERIADSAPSTEISSRGLSWSAREIRARAASINQRAMAWRMYVLDVAAPVDVDSISETIDHVFENVYRYGPLTIDLTGLDSARINGEHLAAVLRATYSWRDQTPGWGAAIEIAKISLSKAGIDPKAALFGLEVA